MLDQNRRDKKSTFSQNADSALIVSESGGRGGPRIPFRPSPINWRGVKTESCDARPAQLPESMGHLDQTDVRK
jgi:hypothetical protein